MLAPTIFIAAAILATAPDAAYAQRGLPGGGPGGQGHAAGAPSGLHGHPGGWRAGFPAAGAELGPRMARRLRGVRVRLAVGLGLGISCRRVRLCRACPGPHSYQFLYDSPYYYPDYNCITGFPYPY